jgi:hypothetical protein
MCYDDLIVDSDDVLMLLNSYGQVKADAATTTFNLGKEAGPEERELDINERIKRTCTYQHRCG